jgi:SAM-dependent methyltransferase
MPSSPSSFDADYYRRYYLDARTAVSDMVEVRQRAAMIVAGLDYVGLPVKRILDAGCGLGRMRAPLLRRLKGAEYVGLETSEYLCERHGWRHGTLESMPTDERFELVVCYDVLQYLAKPAAAKALRNLGRVCRGLLYFGCLTTGDWLHRCDQSRTDRVPGLRPASWYRRELARSFQPLGCGLWLRKGAPATIWDLDLGA